jgi:hypothetical protein
MRKMRKTFFVAAIVASSLLAMSPSSAEAKQQCEVVSGDGKSFGSEIACGDEHFYILEDNNGMARMLAKYNLNTGTGIYRVDIDRIEDGTQRKAHCMEIARGYGAKVRFDNFYGKNDPDHCFYEKELSGDIVQNAEAKSAHWDSNGNYSYPQIGDTYPTLFMFAHSYDQPYVGVIDFEINSSFDHSTYDNTDFFDFSPIVQPFGNLTMNPEEQKIGNQLSGALYEYKSNLEQMGYDVDSIDLLSLDDINKVAKRNGKTLPYSDWSDLGELLTGPGEDPAFDSLKKYLSSDASWIYDSTYWLKTGVDYHDVNQYTLVFVNQKGDICNASVNIAQTLTCSFYTQVTIGAGARPVVVMPDDFIMRETPDVEPILDDKTDDDIENPATDDNIVGHILSFVSSTALVVYVAWWHLRKSTK